MKKIISLFFVLCLLASCGQNSKKSESASNQEVQLITVSDFLSDAGAYIDKSVEVEGTVVHVCRHGGQRLFLVGEDGEKRIRITTGEDIAEFDVELEGEKLLVTGIVKELIIDETYLAEWEAEMMEGSRPDRGEGHEGGVGHGDDHGEDHDQTVPEQTENEDTADAEDQLTSQLARIQGLRDEIAESGKGHLSDYWIETIEYILIKE